MSQTVEALTDTTGRSPDVHSRESYRACSDACVESERRNRRLSLGRSHDQNLGSSERYLGENPYRPLGLDTGHSTSTQCGTSRFGSGRSYPSYLEPVLRSSRSLH